MTKLTTEMIDNLASRKGVRRIAVENFLSTLGSEGASGQSGALLNLHSDAASYKWNSATIRAIESGIKKFFAT